MALLLPALCISASAQRFHTPAEIVKLMEDSKVTYGMNLTDKLTIEADSYENILIGHDLYMEPGKNGQTSLKYYSEQMAENADAREAHEQAEKAFAADNMEEARKHYKEVLDIFPRNSVILTYMGQTYEHEKNYAEAIEWYEKAVEANPVDYMAHWFLADSYWRTDGDIKKAVKHITRAHLLNRNNPRILASVERIYKENGTPYDNWECRPAYALDTNDGGKPRISVDKGNTGWLIYAMCKALWAFEPGYPQTVLENDDLPAFIVEEKECLAVLAVGSANQYGNEPNPDHSITMLTQTIHDETMELFMYYEVLMRRRPMIAYAVSEDVLDTFADYIMRYHTKKEE